jgi:antitoxin ParD1/3/4
LTERSKHPISNIDRLTITLSSDVAATIKGAIAGGDYASTTEVVREALRAWKTRRILQLHVLAALKANLDKGLTDIANRNVKDFDADRISEYGKNLLTSRSHFP